ncbi:IS3 family transposase [Streptomyces sp. YIM B13518]|uniref:IS3 family transposase n=1 Tax=Streptomyces sp. YIM B13518 TaxID=3366316 RepID=UPI00367E9CA1
MADMEGSDREPRGLVLPEVEGLVEIGEAWEPYRLLDTSGAVVRAAKAYFAELQASGNPASTLWSYGMDPLRWWRFLWALGIAWERATQAEGRDLARWMQLADKPVAATASGARTVRTLSRAVRWARTELTGRIQRIHTDSGGIYGSPRVHAVLKREGVHVGRKRVERLMREAGLAGISPRRAGKGFTRRDRAAGLAPDLVGRDFTADGPNRLWVTDLTMIPTGEGLLWLSAIRDALSRRMVAWETAAHADADLVLTTLEYALASREVEPGQLIHHADHGCRYTSVKLTTRLMRAGIEASMGSVGDSYDNALAENLWMLIKTEGLRGRTFVTRAEANLALFEYIDGFCNSRRIQKRLGCLSPVEFEEQHHAEQAATDRANLKPRRPAPTS